MTEGWQQLLVYLVPMAILWAIYGLVRRGRHQRDLSALRQSETAGLTEPASLHPVIDPALCLGCAVCADACPEGQILGIVAGKAVLTDPTSCIGHGACREACPQDAIQLVLGTETRGVDIPLVGADFQTNVEGIYVAGELGGMGLIRNAITQGAQAMDAIAARKDLRSGAGPDVLVIGAGPAGISGSLRAQELGLQCVTVEQDTLGGTVAHYPRGKLVMTAPAVLPGHGKMNFRETSKEALLELWSEVIDRMELEIQFEERVIEIERAERGFVVTTERGQYRPAAILLAIGRRGTPRTLDVPGEERTKVVYRLTDPEQYRKQSVLVVGGGDSAVEAALSVAEEPGTEVTLSYRGDSFSRTKPKNRARLEAAQASDLLQVWPKSNVIEIGADEVVVETSERRVTIPNEAVIVCAGGVLPTALLERAGVRIETRHGEA